MAKKGVGGTRDALEQSSSWFQSRFTEITLALGLWALGGEAGSRAERSLEGLTQLLLN